LLGHDRRAITESVVVFKKRKKGDLNALVDSNLFEISHSKQSAINILVLLDNHGNNRISFLRI
jgi:hypothetical protein